MLIMVPMFDFLYIFGFYDVIMTRALTKILKIGFPKSIGKIEFSFKFFFWDFQMYYQSLSQWFAVITDSREKTKNKTKDKQTNTTAAGGVLRVLIAKYWIK